MPNAQSNAAAWRPAPRFTADEKSLLIDLVAKHKHILKCKKTDVTSTNKRNETWDEVAKHFNSNHGVTPRDAKQLTKCWNNLKQKWKDKKADEKRKVHKTGGGPPPPPMDSASARIGAVASHMETRIPNTHDSDGATYLAPVASEPVVRLLQRMVTGEDALYDSFECDYQPSSPTYSQTRDGDTQDSAVLDGTATAPSNSEPPTAATKVSSVPAADERAPAESEANPGEAAMPRGRLALLQRSLAEEADLRFELMRQEHELRLRLMQEDHDDIIKKRAEEHKLKLENLKWHNDVEMPEKHKT